jgi:hypothetical protein
MNYWLELADRARSGDAQAARELPQELERYLPVIVRRALRNPGEHTNTAGLASAIARKLGVGSGPAHRDGSAVLVEHVTRVVAHELTRRWQPAAPALETVLA